MSIRVAVVDDTTVMRESLVLLMPRLEDAGRFPSAEALLRAAPSADLVVLDLHLANADQPQVRQGVAAVRALVREGYRVCTYSQDERRMVLAACLAAGASGVVSKSSSLATAEQSFCDVAAGELVAPPAVVGMLEVLVRRRSLTVIGTRQRQVLAGRARGLSYAQMSKRLHVSESTLRGYWRDLTAQVSRYLQASTPAEIETALGLGPGDLVEVWPDSGD